MTTEKNGRHRRPLLVAVGILAVAAIIIASVLWRRSQGPITLTFAVYSGNNWGVPASYAYAIYDRAKEMFEAQPENRNIRIRLITGTLYRDYSEWFAQRVLKGQEPDLFMIKEDDFNIFASVGILEDLDPYMRRDRTFDTDSFYPKALEAGAYAGAQYSLPVSVVPSFLIVNKTLLAHENLTIDREHWDWDQFYRICRALTKDTNGDGTIDQFGVYGYTWQNAFYTNGQTLFSPDGTRTVFDNEALEETIEHLKRIYDLNRGTVIRESDFDNGRTGFKQFNLSEYRTYGSYPYRILRYSNFEWEILPFPSGPRGHSISKLYTVPVGMSSRSRHKKEAFEFLKFITENAAFQSQVWKETNVLPANRNVIAGLRKNATNNENDARLLDFMTDNHIMENLYVEPAFKWYADLYAFIDDQIFRIIATDRDIRGSIPTLRTDIERRRTELQESTTP
jgi:multiple sugar transport system substrate-binding protein